MTIDIHPNELGHWQGQGARLRPTDATVCAKDVIVGELMLDDRDLERPARRVAKIVQGSNVTLFFEDGGRRIAQANRPVLVRHYRATV